jgi:Coenzyme PQQ synthesis protein D (PqqD)
MTFRALTALDFRYYYQTRINRAEKMDRHNLLDMVPVKTAREASRGDGKVRFHFTRFRSRPGRWFGKLFGASSDIGLTLDDKSTFVWDLIDGQRNVDQIASVVCEQYTKKPGDCFSELGHLLTTLEKNRLIKFRS